MLVFTIQGNYELGVEVWIHWPLSWQSVSYLCGDGEGGNY